MSNETKNATLSQLPTTPLTPSGPGSTVSSSYRRHGLSPRQRRLLQAAARARAAKSSPDSGYASSSSPLGKASPTAPSSSASPFHSPVSMEEPLSPIECFTPSPLHASSQDFRGSASPAQQNTPAKSINKIKTSRINIGKNNRKGNVTINASESGVSTAITDATTASLGEEISRLRLNNSVGGESDLAEAMRGKVSDRIRRFNNCRGFVNKISASEKSSHKFFVGREAVNDHGEESDTCDDKNSPAKGALHHQIENDEQKSLELKDNKQQWLNFDVSKPSHGYSPTKLPKQQLRREPKGQLTYQSVQSVQSPNPNLRYYRITFKGMISLLPELDTGQYATDAGEISSENENTSVRGNGIFIGYGEIVGSSSPEIVIPFETENGGKEVIKAVHVDSILTGGYSANSDQDDMMQRGFNTVIGKIDEFESESDDTSQQKKFGYLVIRDRFGKSIAEPISSGLNPHSCDIGSFLYCVRASSPVKVLSGPFPDAPPTRCSLLPGSIHDVSLRLSVPLPNQTSDNGDSDILVDDADAGEVKFLRLSQRRGWVADRRIDHLDKDGKTLRVSYLMQDITKEKCFNRSIIDRVSGNSSAMSNSLSLEDTCSLNSSSMANSVSSSSFYSSIVASSVMTPPGIKSRRKRNVRRRNQIGNSRPTVPTFLRENPRLGVDRSFDETSSVTCGGGGTTIISGDGSFSAVENAKSSVVKCHAELAPSNLTESFYLMRVLCPGGLKILDAPHFQVNNLIHTPSPMKSTKSPHTPPVISPFSRTNPEHFSAAKKTGNVSRVRYFARGHIFEASQRMERADPAYTNGQGLVKLADGSGWVIVPFDEEIIQQFENFRSGEVGAEKRAAFEEIGNAVVPSKPKISSHRLTPTERAKQNETVRSQSDFVWLRVSSPHGVKVLLPPPLLEKNIRSDVRNSLSIKHSNSSKDSDGASVVSSSFFDAMWSKVTPTKVKEREHVNEIDARAVTIGKPQIPRHGKGVLPSTPPVIPCGMVVPVERWEGYHEYAEESPKSFLRLYNGQGWIPRVLGGSEYTHEVPAPDIKTGSFWFRVQCDRGVDVRYGPSVHAPVIKSDSGVTFCFECGEFVRASEVFTVFGNKSRAGGTQVDCFAKLYRRQRSLGIDSSSQTLINRFSSLQTVTCPGEWVHVHGSGKFYLEECPNPPSIDRYRDGWRYGVVNEIFVRIGPSFRAAITDTILSPGDVIYVTEKVVAFDDDKAWLRLKSGKGWVCNANEDGEVVVHCHSMVVSGQAKLSAHDTDYPQKMVRQILNNGSHKF